MKPTDKTTEPTCVFKGVIFDVYQWQQQLFDGSVTTFEKLKRTDTVVVLGVTPDKNIILTRQEQPAQPPFLSLPGGMVDKGESPQEAAARELLEETGYTADSWEQWLTLQPMHKIEWSIYVYIARNCQYVQAPHPDAGEKIEVELIDWDQFREVAADPRFRDLEVSLQMLRAERHPEKLAQLKQLLLQ